MASRYFSRRYHSDGFTLVELLLVILIIAILLAIAVPSFVNQKGKAQDSAAEQTVANSAISAKAAYVSAGSNYPVIASLIMQLSTDQPQYSFHSYADGASPSTGSRDISVSRESAVQVSLCSKSDSGRVYCERRNETGSLILADVPSGNSGQNLLADINPLQLVFPEQAAAAISNRTVSTCVAGIEIDARACLANSASAAANTGTASPGWDATPAPITTNPVTLPSYADQVAVDGPGAQCPFDETGTAYVNLKCSNINGQLQDQTPRFTTQQAGAILTDPNDKAVKFSGETHYSYGNPSGGSTNNQGQNWSVEIWVKPAISASNQAIVSADDNWALRFAGSAGFTCDMRVGNPWSVISITGGPPSVAGSWYMVDCSYAAGLLTLYVNGVQVAQRSGCGIGQSGNGNFRPGYISSGWTGGTYLNGVLDQFSFYKTTLSAARITAHYTSAGYQIK